MVEAGIMRQPPRQMGGANFRTAIPLAIRRSSAVLTEGPELTLESSLEGRTAPTTSVSIIGLPPSADTQLLTMCHNTHNQCFDPRNKLNALSALLAAGFSSRTQGTAVRAGEFV